MLKSQNYSDTNDRIGKIYEKHPVYGLGRCIITIGLL